MIAPLPTSQTQIPDGFIDLGVGDPPLPLLPLDMIREAAQARLSQNDPACLQYGMEQGDGNFRLALAGFLGREYGFPVDAKSLFATNGISSALDLACTLFTAPGDTIFVEDPNYYLSLPIFADHGLRIVSIDTDEAGLNLDSLAEKLAESRPKFIYLVPTFQNPTGRTLTLARRERLVQLSKEHDFIILADEVYHFLGYTQSPPTSFAAYTHVGNVIALGTFSKILAPGLRLGWIQAHARVIDRFTKYGMLGSGGGLNPFASAVVREILESGGLKANIEKLKNIYGSRVAVMDKALRQYLPQLKYDIPHGGYFFWIRLPKGMDASALQKRARDFNIGFQPGIRFSSRGLWKDYIRIGFAFYEPETFVEGLARLKHCLDAGD